MSIDLKTVWLVCGLLASLAIFGLTTTLFGLVIVAVVITLLRRG